MKSINVYEFEKENFSLELNTETIGNSFNDF